MSNPTIRTPKTSGRLLRHLTAGRSIACACRLARISRAAYYSWRKDDPAFARRADEAIEEGTDAIEDEALRRAIAGSDRLMILLLKARRPEKYRDRSGARVSGSPRRMCVVIRDADAERGQAPRTT